MIKLLTLLLSILFSVHGAHAEMTLVRSAVCHVGNKNYILLNEKPMGLTAGEKYVILEKNLDTPAKLPRSLEGSFQAGSANLDFPAYWRPVSIPLAACKEPPLRLFFMEEVIREFYVKTYFISGDPRTITEDIEDLVQRGEAIPLKVRVLCKSDDITDDVTLCHEITILDKIIPVNPNE